MAGKITVSTLNNDTGVLATQNGMTGIAKAWVQFAGSTGTIAGSFNVSSVTRNGTGDYTVNFTTSMPNTTYSAIGSAGSLANDLGSTLGIVSFGIYSASAIKVRMAASASSADYPQTCVAILAS